MSYYLILNLPVKSITRYVSMQNDKVSRTAFFITAYMTPSNFALLYYMSSTIISIIFLSVSLFSFSLSLFTFKHTSKCLLTWVWGLSVAYVCHMSVCARLHVRVRPGVCPCDCMAGCVWVSPRVVMKCLVSQAQCLNLGLQLEGATSQNEHSAQPGHHALL